MIVSVVGVDISRRLLNGAGEFDGSGGSAWLLLGLAVLVTGCLAEVSVVGVTPVIAALMVMLSVAVAVPGVVLLSLTVMVALAGLLVAAVGVPEMTPVVVLKLRPAGSVPLMEYATTGPPPTSDGALSVIV